MLVGQRKLIAVLPLKWARQTGLHQNNNQLQLEDQRITFKYRVCFSYQKFLFSFATTKIVNPYEKYLKKFFSNRFEFSKDDFMNTFRDVINTSLKHKKQKFNRHAKQKSKDNNVVFKFSARVLEKDHRWINLIIAFQNNFRQFNFQQRLEIMILLVRAGIHNQLLQKLISDTVGQIQMLTIDKTYNQYGEIKSFNIQDACYILWIVAKTKIQPIKNIKIINDFILHFSTKKVLVLSSKKKFEKVQDKQNVTFITPFGISQAMWALGEAQIIDRMVIKFLANLIKQNMQQFTISQACILLKSLVCLDMQHKRITLSIMNKIMESRSLKMIQTEDNKSLKNLLFSISFIRKHKIYKLNKCETSQEKDFERSQIQKLQKFVYWLTQTILIKYQYNLSLKSCKTLIIYLKRSRVPYNSITHKPIFSELINKNVGHMLVKELFEIENILLQLYQIENSKYLKQKRDQSSQKQLSNQIKELEEFLTVIEERLWSLFYQLSQKDKSKFLEMSYNFLTKPPKYIYKHYMQQVSEYERNKEANLKRKQFNEQNNEELQKEWTKQDQQ